MDRALLIGRILLLLFLLKYTTKFVVLLTENESEINLWNAGKYF